jgi:DNA-binding response OmpR family regulator
MTPLVKILLSSGNRDDTRVQELLANGVDDFIQKPYPLHELARKVHRLVNPE